MTTGLAASVLNGWLNALGNAANYTAPTAVWIKLHTGDPGAAGSNFAAANTTRKQASFAPAAGGAITTDADLAWASVPNSETYSHWSAWDASSGGNFLASDALNVPKSVVAGNTFTIAAGDLDIAGSPVAA